ncbi:E3 ubiquitin-protein ligase TRIM9-like [Clavelina lepadiformis]|uniref:E3 ubiquitin-protein ligase TRIM9-like n=1 Tax=Clavelina lepadiformis TaxID=159417 RepID=UPI00404226F3
MEEELQCPVCHQLFDDPVILPCTHNVCFKCAETLILKNRNLSSDVPPQYKVDKTNYKPSVDADKASVISEAVLSDSDSGYSAGSSGSTGDREKPEAVHNESSSPPVLGSNVSRLVSSFQSRGSGTAPQQSVNATTPTGVNMPALPQSVSCLTCPICHRTLFLDDRGVAGLSRHTLMKSIVDRYEKSHVSSAHITAAPPDVAGTPQIAQTTPVLTGSNPDAIPKCQLCESDSSTPASVQCLQCQVLYCAACRDRCHPPRGPLAQHSLVNVTPLVTSQKRHSSSEDKPNVYRKNKFPPLPNKPSTKNYLKLESCSQHPTEKTSLHCGSCRVSLCVQCHEEGRHKNHDVKAIGALYKTQKSDLSNKMSALSNKARQAKDLVMQLRGMQEDIDRSSVELEAATVAQCNHLIEAVERKRDEFIRKIAREKELKSKTVRQQLQQCTLKLKQTTGLLEYCIEVMKDNDAAAFLQISQSLIERVVCSEKQWSSRALHPKAKIEFDLDLETSHVALAIEKLDFVQMKVPDKPTIKVEECGSQNNTVTLVWKVPTTRPVDGFKLEMDNGSNGPFREVYCGKESVCTVDGLHFNSRYRARVRAFNKSGAGPYSDVLQLQTSEVAHFQLDPKQTHEDIKLSNNNTSVTSDSYDSRVVIGSVGFSKGIHYWEFSIDQYEAKPDPAFGVALGNVNKSIMLGKDSLGWSLYVDEERAWLLHNNQHVKRTEVDVKCGSRVGVFLDLTRRLVNFFIDGKPLGVPLSLGLSTSSQMNVFYPAVSVNRQVQVTLHTGLRCPPTIKQPPPSPRMSSSSDAAPNQKRAPSPHLKTQLSFDRKQSLPPPPPLRRSSSGNMSVKSDGDGSTASDPTPGRSFMSFLRR